MTAPQKEQTQPGGAGLQDAHLGTARDDKDTSLVVDLEQARRFLETFDAPDAVHHFRALDPRKILPAYNFAGTFAAQADNLQLASEQGYGVFAVINEGGQKKAKITRVRAVFADFDQPEAWERVRADPDILKIGGRDPHAIVETSPGKFHVYWKVDDLPPEQFESVQLAIASRFGSDRSVQDLSRVMRLPGFLHAKGEPYRSRLLLSRPTQPSFSAQDIAAAFPADSAARSPSSLSFSSFSPSAQFGNYGDAGNVVSENRHADLRLIAAQLARKVVFDGWGRDAALATLFQMRASGRWTRDMPDAEITDALDDGIEKCRSGEWRDSPAANDPVMPDPAVLAEALARELTLFTEADYARASVPHPHVFSDGNAGMFPIGEVTTIAAPGREGKTTATTFVVSRAALGVTIAGLACKPMRVLIYSNEDDRIQYARKIMALRSLLSVEDGARLHQAIVVPDLEAPDLMQVRALVELTEKRRPVPTAMVDAIIDAVQPWVEGDDPVGAIVFETVSTLSEADEDNPGLKALTAAAKRIARRLNVAVILVHHTNQSAGSNYQGLNFSVADMRGGTVLPYNSRQCLLLVSLGSEEEPFPADDGRTRLRKLVTGQLDGFGFHDASGARISVLVPLDTSKAANPPPAFFAWIGTPFGPAVREILPPEEYVGMKWPRLLQALHEKNKAEKAAKKAAEAAEIDLLGEKSRAKCVEAVVQLEAAGKAPTVKSVSVWNKKGNDWAKPYLATAVKLGDLVCRKEKVPHTKGEHDVYRLPPAAPDED